MRKRILNNWGLKLTSLALALILWFLVAQIGDPLDTKTFNNISVKLTNTDLLVRENKVYEILDDTNTASVTVRAPKSIIDKLRSSDIVAEADVSKLTDINTVVISYSIPYVDGVDSIVGNHEVVRLNVEDKRTKWISVKYNTVGEVAEDYIVANVQPDQTQVEISGPKSVVDTISYAGVEVDITGSTSNLSANVDIDLYDYDNKVVKNDSVKTNVEYVHMSVEVLATKEVPVEIGYMGVPAEGYMATSVVKSEPSAVRIAGTVYSLAGVSRIVVPEERLNITGESSDMMDVINLRDYLPESVRWADPDFNGKITATVYIEPIVERTLEVPLDNLTIENMPEGWIVHLPEEDSVVSVKVSGLAAQINPLRQAEVKGFVDMKEWMEAEDMEELSAGEYTVPVQYILEDGVTSQPVEIQITVAEKI